MFINRNTSLTVYLGIILISFSCNNSGNEVENPLFTALESNRTGLEFRNDLKPTPTFNMFKYMYFYNGAGVGAGDFNKDGLIDLFFASNQGENKLYINEGGLKFKDQTKLQRFRRMEDGLQEFRLLILIMMDCLISMFAGLVIMNNSKVIINYWFARDWIRIVFPTISIKPQNMD